MRISIQNKLNSRSTEETLSCISIYTASVLGPLQTEKKTSVQISFYYASVILLPHTHTNERVCARGGNAGKIKIADRVTKRTHSLEIMREVCVLFLTGLFLSLWI